MVRIATEMNRRAPGGSPASPGGPRGATKSHHLLLLLATLSLTAPACEDPPDTGILVIAIDTLSTLGTPLEGMRAVLVNSTRVDVVLQSVQDDPDTETVVTVNSSPEIVLFSGVPETGVPSIGTTLNVPVGFVAQVRVIVSEIVVSFPDGSTELVELEAEVGSGPQTGIKIIPDDGEEPFEVRKNEATILLVTYDPAFQVLDPPAPAMGLRMKPVLRAIEVELEDLPSRVEDLFLLRFVDGTTDLDKMALLASLGVTSRGEMDPELPVEVIDVPPGANLDDLVLAALADPIVDWASTETFAIWATPNPRPVPGEFPNDELFDREFHLFNDGSGTRREGADIHVARTDEAWDLQIGSKEVIVAFVDTGVKLDHPELVRNMFLNEGELPMTCRAGETNSLDFDNDGIVTFWDLNDDPDPAALAACGIADVAGVAGMIDCLDLIEGAVADMVDTDFNRVVDDFCGADFSRVFFDPECTDVTGFCRDLASNLPIDLDGHGTAAAGVLGSETNNGELLAGVAWNVRMLPIAASPTGSPARRSVNAYGLGYAAEMGAHVVVFMQQLLQSAENFDILSEAEREMRLAGFLGQYSTMFFGQPITDTLIVWGAGGFLQKRDCDKPEELCGDWEALRNLDTILVVGATNWHDKRLASTNEGATTVDLGAPGGSMPLLDLEGYFRIRDGGTSMAAAITGGVAGLVFSHDDLLIVFPDPSRVRDAILDGADHNVRNLNNFWVEGRRLNATGALDEL